MMDGLVNFAINNTTGTQVNATSTEGRQDVDIFRAQMEFYF